MSLALDDNSGGNYTTRRWRLMAPFLPGTFLTTKHAEPESVRAPETFQNQGKFWEKGEEEELFGVG